MTEHTPGPLTYEIGEYTGKNWLIATVVDYGGSCGCITTDHVHASEFVLGDFEADLRLWAAAPELLAACKLAIEMIDDDAPGPGTTERDLLRQLRAAIAKAGRQ